MTQFQGSKKLRSIFTKERKVEYQTPGCEFSTVQITDPYPRKEAKMGLSHMVAELKKKNMSYDAFFLKHMVNHQETMFE